MLQKSSMQLVAEVFFRFPTKEHTLKDVSRRAGIAHTSVKHQLGLLTREGLILQRTEKRGRRKFPLYRAHRTYKRFVQYKTIFNLQALLESGILPYLEEQLMPRCIVLFGSFQRGEDMEESDIDLFVEGKRKELSLKHFEGRLERTIELHFKEHFPSYPKELKNNIINGIVLHGFLEGYP